MLSRAAIMLLLPYISMRALRVMMRAMRARASVDAEDADAAMLLPPLLMPR